MAEVSDTSDANDTGAAGNTSSAGDPNGSAGARSPGDPSILISEAETSESGMEALSELEEISAALVEPPPAAPTSLAALTPSTPGAPSGASISGPKSGAKPQQRPLEGVQALVGTIISGRYQVVEVLAAGGMGCVYRGEHVHMHKRVAIKVLLPNTERLPELVQRFKREAVAGAHIDHPNIAAATDFGMLDDGAFFLILQFVRGVTLHDVIRRGPLPAARAARIARQIASALDACHGLGIVHRDLKPRNIMVEEDRDDFVKLIDFGFAKVPMDRIGTIEKKASLKDMKVTAMGTIFGTPSYMPPEIALGMDAVDERSDLYAFGVIIYEMLAGAHPFDTKDPSALLLKHRTVVPPPIAERTGVDVPPAMEAIAMRLMMKDPTLRYPSAAAVVEAIDEAMGGAQPSRKPPSTQPPPGSSPPQASSQPSPRSSPPQASSQPSPSQASSQPSPSQASSQPSPSQASSQPSPSQASSQPSPSQASSPPQALSPPSAPASAPALSAAPNPAIAPKPGEPAARPRGAKRSSSRTAVPRWALPAAFLSLLAAIGVVVIALRSLDRPAPAVQRDVSAPPAPTAPATVTAAPSAAATPSAAPSVSEPRSDTTLAPLRADMRAAADSKEWDRGAEALVALADRDPNAFEDRDVARAAVAIAAGITLGGDKRADADKVFDALSTKLGAAGLDILYDIVSTRGGSNAASRASKILRNKKVLERASPALRIAIELRDAPSCKERLALLDRAKKDGDTRAVAVLDIWRAQRCITGAGECCFRTNSAVDDTMKQIWTRVRSSPTE